MLRSGPLAAIAALLPVLCNGFCDLPTMLPLTNRSWTIGWDGNYDFWKQQSCRWDFHNNNFLQDILFLYISPFDFRSSNRCVGDIALDATRLCTVREPECMLFTDNLTNIDFSNIQSQVGYEGNPCRIWRIENKRLRAVSMRTFDAVTNLTLKIQYRYIKQREKTFTGLRRGDVSGERADDVGITDHTFEIIDRVCSKCTGYIIAFAVTLFCLCIALVILAKCAHVQSLLIGKRQPRVRGSFFQTESIDDEVDEEALRSPVPLATPKSPDKKGNTSYFFQSMEEKDEENRKPSEYVKAEYITEQGGTTAKPTNFWVDENGESYYDIPKSTPAYAEVRKKTKASTPKTEG